MVVWCKNCIHCKRFKVTCHSKSSVFYFRLPSARSAHVDEVGPLSLVRGMTYPLTCVDAFKRWPEAFPIPDQSSDTIVRAFLLGWISRFGVPEKITSDRVTNFKNNHFSSLSKFLATRRILPNTSVTTPESSFLQTLRRHVRSFIPVLTSHHWSGPLFVSGDLLKASHVVLRIHRIRKSLEPPYAGPYKVLSRTSKVFTMEVNSRPVTVSIDRLKAVHMFPDEVSSRISSPIPTCSAQISDDANRYGRRSRLVVQF
ncbi:hypothetical protein AVEN_39237-1 [Araneus ventricosus]|uniref:Integrase catalytic domain-containing protein n=1 Tax=Araneus ventricosus TaxID=182803 RepID=A0A4Y2ESZ8_ARAVE|nr:hypothetical protein AVEN_39237-1 [Araneus ventricosus]